MELATPVLRRLELPLGTLKSRIRSGLKTLRSLLEGS
jgi:DNA-directed RNA polymerase specialized sigma24 family protein